MNFSDRLQIVQESTHSCLLLSITPPIETLEQLKTLYQYIEQKIDTSKNYICGVSLKMAYFEYFGGAGIESLSEMIRHIHSFGLIVVLDEQKSLTGKAATLAAERLFSENQLNADAVTLNPYLGSDAIVPFIENATINSSGIFIITRTANPSAKEFQESEDLAIRMAEKIEEWNIATQSEKNLFSSVGAVVTATEPGALKFFREELPHTWILATGMTQPDQISDALKIQRNGLGLLIELDDEHFKDVEDIQIWYEAQKN